MAGGRSNDGVAHYPSATLFKGLPVILGVAGITSVTPPQMFKFDYCVVGGAKSYPSRFTGKVVQTVVLTQTGEGTKTTEIEWPCSYSLGLCRLLSKSFEQVLLD